MSWTAPRTWVTGETLTSTLLNTHLRDNMIALRSSYGTTFPGSPNDGDEAVLVDNASNPSYQWQFRYNAGSSSAFKWEFIGGAAIVVNAASTTLPAHNGDYIIRAKYNSNESGGTTSGADEAGLLKVNGATVDTTTQNGPSTAASGGGNRGTASFSNLVKVTGATASTSVAITSAGGAGTTPLNPQISIEAVRLS